MNTTALFWDYTDPFAGTPENGSSDKPNFHKLMRELHKSRRKNKKLKKVIKEQRAAVEQCAVTEAQKKEKPFLLRMGEAIVKAVPVVLTAIVGFFMKGFFSRQNEAKRKCECKCA